MRKKTPGPRRHTGRRVSLSRRVHAAGLTGAAVGGALLTMAITASQAVAESGPSSLPDTIDQILAAQQAAVASDSALPFATPDSNALLPAGLQNLAAAMLMVLISAGKEGTPVFFVNPEATAADASDPRQLFGYFSPNTHYYVAALDPDASYVLTGTIGNGTGQLGINNLSGGIDNAATGGGLDLGSTLKVNPDGTYAVDIGPTEPGGAVNYLDVPDSGPLSGIIVRDSISNWAMGPGSLGIKCVADCPNGAGGAATGLPSEEQLTQLLHGLALGLGPFNNEFMTIAKDAGIALPANTMTDFQSEGGFTATALPTQVSAIGHYDLQPDHALIVKVPDVPAAGFSDIEVETVFGQTIPGTLAQTSLNSTQTFHDSDGYNYYVISATNPGVANWLDIGDSVTSGEIIARYESFPADADPTGKAVTTSVVPLADVRQYLPADTPVVTPAEYAATLNERVLSYNLDLDALRQQNANFPWDTQELLLRVLQNAMGAKQFDAVFGEQPATPMWLRLTPALSPDLATLVKDMLANPSGSLAAIHDSMTQAANDIELPVKLAGELLGLDILHSAQAVQGAISSGNPLAALTALASGIQQLGTDLGGALIDPATSITSGLLNARDDLATAVMAATRDGFPSQLGPLATWEWQHMAQLAHPAAGGAAIDVSSALSTDTSAAALSEVLSSLGLSIG